MQEKDPWFQLQILKSAYSTKNVSVRTAVYKTILALPFMYYTRVYSESKAQIHIKFESSEIYLNKSYI